MIAAKSLIALALCLGASTAAAAVDPLVGNWQADMTKANPPNHFIVSQSLTIKPAASGYTMHLSSTMVGGSSMAFDVPVVPDGAPHSLANKYGVATTTCHSSGSNQMDCKLSMVGDSSDASFVVSADGATLTETDFSDVEHVHDSAQTSVTVANGSVSHGPSTSQHQQAKTREKEVTVFRRH